MDLLRASNPVPVFPLPNVVFFPRTVLPLHVFEPRYRALVRDASGGEGLIAVALLCGDWRERYEGSPPFRPVGTVGRIEDLRPLPDGRFVLRLVGVQRVELGRVVRATPYRSVRFRPLAENPVDDGSAVVRQAKLDLLASQACLLRELSEESTANIVLDERIPLEAAVNGACANLPVEAEARQALLEENDLLRRMERVASLIDTMLQRILQIKARRGGPGEGTLN